MISRICVCIDSVMPTWMRSASCAVASRMRMTCFVTRRLLHAFDAARVLDFTGRASAVEANGTAFRLRFAILCDPHGRHAARRVFAIEPKQVLLGEKSFVFRHLAIAHRDVPTR